MEIRYSLFQIITLLVLSLKELIDIISTFYSVSYINTKSITEGRSSSTLYSSIT